jgi:hypothetical protein
MTNVRQTADRQMLGICPGDSVLVSEHRGDQEIVHNALCSAISMQQRLLGTQGEPAIEVAILVKTGGRQGSAGLQLFPGVVHLSHRDWLEGRAGLAYEEVPQNQRVHPGLIKATEVLGILRQQHDALDLMLAMRAATDRSFFPSKSGPIWDAVVAGQNAILRMEAETDRTEIDGTPFYKCPVCQAISYHPQDIENGYCGRCHDFTRTMPMQLLPRKEA